jgi:hypothetical protein
MLEGFAGAAERAGFNVSAAHFVQLPALRLEEELHYNGC